MFPAPCEPSLFTHASHPSPPTPLFTHASHPSGLISSPLPTQRVQNSVRAFMQAAGAPKASGKPFLGVLDKLLEMQLKELARELDPKGVREVYPSQDLSGKRQSWLKRLEALGEKLDRFSISVSSIEGKTLIAQMEMLIARFREESSLTLESASRMLEIRSSFLVDRLVQQELSRANCVAIQELFSLLAPFGLKESQERCALWRSQEEADPHLPRSNAYSSLPNSLSHSLLLFRVALKRVALSMGEIRACADFDRCLGTLEAEVELLIKRLSQHDKPGEADSSRTLRLATRMHKHLKPELVGSAMAAHLTFLECQLFRIPYRFMALPGDIPLWSHFELMTRRAALSDEHVGQIKERMAPAFFKACSTESPSGSSGALFEPIEEKGV